MFEMFGYPEFSSTGEQIITTRNGIYKDMLMDIRVFRMKAGDRKAFSSPGDEQIILLLTGEIELSWGEGKAKASRSSVFEENPYLLHVPKDVPVEIEAESDAEILVQKTENGRDFTPIFYTPKDTRIVVSGEGHFDGKATRLVKTVVDYEKAPYSNLVIGEIITEAGGWSSYVPHGHPQPEVYYYRYDRPEGFGAQFVGEDVFKIKDRSFSALPDGKTHPCVTAPGYRLFTCWMIRHFDGNPWTDRIDDPRYTWLLSESYETAISKTQFGSSLITKDSASSV
jgi:5-deoxy-glucuronate isomerase